MKIKPKLKWTLDVLMTIALLFLMGYQFWGEAAHEWIGAGMFVLFIGHQVCNLNWYKNLFSLKNGIFRQGKYTPMRIFQTLINLLTLAAMLMQIYSGIILSRHVFAFLPIQGGMALARRMHILGSYWGFLFMSLHLGLHWGMVLNVAAKLRNRGKAGGNKFSVVSFLAGLAVAAYGLVVFIKRDFLDYMLLKSEFVFLDYEESKFLFFLDYLALMGLGVFLAHYGAKLLKGTGRRTFLCSICLACFLAACAGQRESDPEEPLSQVQAPSQEETIQPPADSKENDSIATEEGGQSIQTEASETNILIAYFTWADNTEVEEADAAIDAALSHYESVGDRGNYDGVDATTSASVLVPGNTARMAAWIQERTGGDLFSIVVSEPYSSVYDECLDLAADEKAENVRPGLRSHVEHMEQYDTTRSLWVFPSGGIRLR